MQKVVLITGAARRIGAEIARYFHTQSYNVIVHYRTSEQEALNLQQELNQIRPNSVVIIKADLANLVNTDFVTEFVTRIRGFYGQLDVLVNNASTFFATPLGNSNLEQWRDLMVSNAGGPFFLAQALMADLKKTQGSIINISDIHGVRPMKGYSIYSIAKAANDMLTKTLARELAPEINVNGVAPGPVLWPEHENELNSEEKHSILRKTLSGRQCTALNIAKTVLFLAENKDITGQVLAVDGGRSIKN